MQKLSIVLDGVQHDVPFNHVQEIEAIRFDGHRIQNLFNLFGGLLGGSGDPAPGSPVPVPVPGGGPGAGTVGGSALKDLLTKLAGIALGKLLQGGGSGPVPPVPGSIQLMIDGQTHDVPKEHVEAIKAAATESMKFDGHRIAGLFKSLFPNGVQNPGGTAPSGGILKGVLLQLAGVALKGLIP